MKCKNCDGVGWTAEHAPYCLGDCENHGCPYQVQCEKCQGTGIITDAPANIQQQVQADSPDGPTA
jgi:hypothetical protein